MNSSITQFLYGFNKVRVFLDAESNPWFAAKDVCEILGLENTTKALYVLDEDEKITLTNSDGNPRAGIPNQLTYISESGLYALVFRSRKPEAKAFSKWVRSVVLPSLRKTGRFGIPENKAFANQEMPIPENIISLSYNLKPAMRQRLWRDAMETARLDGGGIDLACRCFESLCAMMTATRKVADSPTQIILFMNECLEYSKGHNTSFQRIFSAFSNWWKENGAGDQPGTKTLATHLLTRFQAYKSSVMTYRDCRIRK